MQYGSPKPQPGHMSIAALSGNGTKWHWFEDKLMGAKAALLQMSGNPLVMFADTTDVMFNCPADEILDRFKQSGAEILIGGETQLWPEIETYFDMKRERDADRPSYGEN